jgi:hypothetical protein
MAVMPSWAAAKPPNENSITRRTPKRSMRLAMNGPHRPYNTRLIETAIETVTRVQPNSCSMGRIRTAGVARMPAVTSSARNVTPVMIQA